MTLPVFSICPIAPAPAFPKTWQKRGRPLSAEPVLHFPRSITRAHNTALPQPSGKASSWQTDLQTMRPLSPGRRPTHSPSHPATPPVSPRPFARSIAALVATSPPHLRRGGGYLHQCAGRSGSSGARHKDRRSGNHSQRACWPGLIAHDRRKPGVVIFTLGEDRIRRFAVSARHRIQMGRGVRHFFRSRVLISASKSFRFERRWQ